MEEVAQGKLSDGNFLETGEISESLANLLTGICTIGAFEGDFLTEVRRGFLWLRRSDSRDRELP